MLPTLMVIPRRELRQQCPRGSTWRSFHFIYVFDESKLRYQNPHFWSAFLKSWKPLSPEGNCESSAREGPLDGLSILYVFHEPKLRFQNPNFWSAFLKSWKPLLSGWVGWWVGGDQKGPSIFFIFEYVNKQCVFSKYSTKRCHRLFYGFENFVSSLGLGFTIFKFTLGMWVF